MTERGVISKGGEGGGGATYGSPEFARWLNGPVTKFCGHGYHQGSDGLGCEGTISTVGVEAPCLCECHR